MLNRRHLLAGLGAAGVTNFAPAAFAAQTPDGPPDYRATVIRVSEALAPGEIHVLPDDFHLYWTMPEGQAIRYWGGVAARAGFFALLDIALHVRRSPRPGAARLARNALLQFAPAVAAGAALAFALGSTASGVYLPGLWSIVFALGLGAARPQLPRGVSGVVAFHLLAGLLLLVRAEPGFVPSPWAMGGVFALGQALLALVLHADILRHPEGGLDD